MIQNDLATLDAYGWGRAQLDRDAEAAYRRVKVEIIRLEERVSDYEDDQRAVMEEPCNGDDRRHCTCVPPLRREIARMELLNTGLTRDFNAMLVEQSKQRNRAEAAEAEMRNRATEIARLVGEVARLERELDAARATVEQREVGYRQQLERAEAAEAEAERLRGFVAHTSDEYAHRLPTQWKAHARALLAGSAEQKPEDGAA